MALGADSSTRTMRPALSSVRSTCQRRTTESPVNIAVLHAPTPEGDAALTAASQRARETSAPLTVLIVHNESPATEVAAAAVRESVADSVRATVGDTETRYRELGPSNGADAIATLIDHIDDANYDLIVLGTKRRSTVGKLLLGRDIQRIVLEVTAPILLVKPR